VNLVSGLALTKHAHLRMAQRNISPSDIEYVLEYGERIHATGAVVYILRKRDIPEDDRNKSEITRLEGTVILIGPKKDGKSEIITTYRNKSVFKAFRCKAKYNARKKNWMDPNSP
jgi:polynucleotide 5'-kinase involved in rRNA processing